MDRRELIAAALAAGVPALPEVTAPATPEARLRAAVSRWLHAESAVASTLRTLHTARDAIYAATVEGASERALARLVEARQAAKAEWRSAQREQAEAEAVMESASRAVREG